MYKKLVLVLSLYLLSHLSVVAQENEEGLYGSIFGGLANFNDGKVDVKRNDSGAADFEIDSGNSAGLRLGYDFGRFRMEGEYSHMQANIGKLKTSTGDVSVDSGVRNNGFMLNALVDFDLDPIVLSAGLGFGSSKVKFEEMTNSGFIAVAETNHSVSSHQAIINASYAVNENASIGVNYRYLKTSDMAGEGFVDTEGGGQSDIEYDGLGVSLIEIFFSYKF